MDAGAGIAWFLLWENAQQIAVVIVQSAEAGGLFHFGKIAAVLGALGLALILRQHPSARMGDNALPDAGKGVILAQITGKPHKAFFSRWAHGNILADLILIPVALEIRPKLPLRHRLADGLVYVILNRGLPCGASLFFSAPLSVMLGLSALWVFDHGQAVFPAKLI